MLIIGDCFFIIFHNNSFLFSVTLNNPIKGLLNICALYLLHNDIQTAELVVKELKAYENDLKYSSDVAFLISTFFAKKNDYKSAISYILSMIHKFPVNPKLRTIYVNLTLTCPEQSTAYQMSGSRMAQSILSLNHSELLKRYENINFNLFVTPFNKICYNHFVTAIHKNSPMHLP